MQRNFYMQPNYYVGEDEHVIAVSESAECPGSYVVIESRDEDYFGKFRLVMPVEFMRILARTILKVCDEVETNKGQV